MEADQKSLNHLFGLDRYSERPGQLLYLSTPLTADRRLTAYEAQQIREQSQLRADTSASWVLSPLPGRKASLSKLVAKKDRTRRVDCTFHFKLARHSGLLRLSHDIGSGRSSTDDELLQLRSIGGALKHAHASWIIKPVDGEWVEILRWRGRQLALVSKVRVRSAVTGHGEGLAHPDSPQDQAILSMVF